MNAVEYNRELWGDKVRNLFKSIYPNWKPAQWERMVYDENLPLHKITLLAVTDNNLLGQVNVFIVANGADLANVGYHVHPQWHKRGIGSFLLYEVLTRVHETFEDGLVIQTNESNEASWRLAEKAGFQPASDDLIQKYKMALKFLGEPDGICLHLSRASKWPKALQRTAIRVAAEL